MRIIAGKYKNRTIPYLKNVNYRPSTMKLREAIFSILASSEFEKKHKYKDADILDLFSGTGSLAFEALSRGAKSITLLDINRYYLKVAENFAVKIGERRNVKCYLTNATKLPLSLKQYSLVFIDPPYYKQFAIKALTCLIRNQWLKDNSILVIELGKYEDFFFPESLQLVKKKIYANSKLYILRYIE